MKLRFSKTLVLLVSGFCLFVFMYHAHEVRRIQKAMKEHARIVAGSLWDLNPKGAEEYLQAVAQHNNYKYIVVRDTNGVKFITITQPELNSIEKYLVKLKLILQMPVSADIIYHNELLGRVDALWLDKSIYTYAYAFIVVLLLFMVIQLYSRVLRAKATLEKKVEDRTRNLSKKTEELQESEKSYRTLAENLPGLVYRLMLGNSGRIQFLNHMLEPMTGYREAEMEAGSIYSIDFRIVPEDRAGIIATIENALKEKVPFDVEYRFLHKSGGIRYFHERGRPVFGDDGKPVFIDGVIFDITDRMEAVKKQQALEVQLQQAQKLEALGALAGGITHDFNNILTSIYGYAQLMLSQLPDDSQVKVYLKNMLDAAHRARELVRQILTFSRQESQKQSPVEVQIIVKEALKLLRASIPATIEIRQDIVPDCGSVLANPTQIHQILMNLCTNAYHAMRETGGILSVSLAPYEVRAGEVINGLTFQAGSFLRLEINDTGCGMDRKTLERIFEPYFTTKLTGEGTGMGLSVVHGIVKSQGGHITVSSVPGQGATFHIYWPVIQQSAALAESEFPQSLPRGDEHVLLIDDEFSTLQVEAEILKNLGYTIDACKNPQNALTYFQEQPDRFDLIITDMTMPVMTGDEFSRKILAMCPEIPIILCTGYSEIITEAKAKAIGINALVMKPINIREFAFLIRGVLAEGKPSQQKEKIGPA